MQHRAAKLVLVLIAALLYSDARCLMACVNRTDAPQVQQSEQQLPPCHRKHAPVQSNQRQNDCPCIQEPAAERAERPHALAPEHIDVFLTARSLPSLPALGIDLVGWSADAIPSPPLLRLQFAAVLRV